MRVLHVTNMYPCEADPGFGSFVKAQIDSLQALGVQCDVFFIEGYRSQLNYLKAIPQIINRVKTGQYDLVHAHYGLSGLAAWPQKCVPLVVSYCGDDLYGHANSEGKPTPSSLFWVYWHKLLSKYVDACIVKSAAMGRLLPINSAVVIANGVDFSRFLPMDQAACRQQLKLDPQTRYILFPYNPSRKRKNYAAVSAALPMIQAALSVPVEILVVKGVPHSQLPVYMNAADAMILASCWEGSPNAVKEAMACNLPVVSTDVGDVPELFAGLDDHFICLPEPDDIAKQLLKVLTHPKRSRAREAMNDLRMERVAQRVVDVYTRVLKK